METTTHVASHPPVSWFRAILDCSLARRVWTTGPGSGAHAHTLSLPPHLKGPQPTLRSLYSTLRLPAFECVLYLLKPKERTLGLAEDAHAGVSFARLVTWNT